MAKRERRQEGSGERFKWFQIEILVVFSALILIVTAFLDFVILERSGRAMQQTVSELIAANSRQLELNINSYLERMETTSTLLFSDESYYMYDATDENEEEYDKVKSEEAIKDRIETFNIIHSVGTSINSEAPSIILLPIGYIFTNSIIQSAFRE